MVTIEIQSEQANQIVREVEFNADHEGRKKASFLLGVSAFIVRWQEDSKNWGLKPGTNFVCISYQLFMGEILIALRNAGVEEEEEWVTLSNLDREFQKYLGEEPYL